MIKNQILTTEGSLLFPLSKNKEFVFLKNDPLNNFLWKPIKKATLTNTTKKLELFKTRFLF
jgi:hypothetical protein